MTKWILVLALALCSQGASALIECQSLTDLDYIQEFPGFHCPEGFIQV